MVGETETGQSPWTPPYPASWVDRLQDWLTAGRLPAWSIYILAWFVVWALVSGPLLLTGTGFPTRALRVHAGSSANVVLFLAATHALDGAARDAIGAFMPALRAHQPSFRDLEYALTTMPARPVLLISLLGAALPVLFSPVSVPGMRQFHLAESPLSVVRDIGLVSIVQSATFAVFVFHTIRQLRVVSRIHRQHARISLFRLQSLNDAISSLATEREVIRRTPTWPWSPGALGVLTSAVLLPIVVWLLQRLLERALLP